MPTAHDSTDLDITDWRRYRRLIAEVRPDEFYNLAGLSSVRRSFDDPTVTWRSNADAVLGLLEAIRVEIPTTRSSSPHRPICSGRPRAKTPSMTRPLRSCHRARMRPPRPRRMSCVTRIGGRSTFVSPVDPVEPRIAPTAGVVPDRQGRRLRPVPVAGRTTASSRPRPASRRQPRRPAGMGVRPRLCRWHHPRLPPDRGPRGRLGESGSRRTRVQLPGLRPRVRVASTPSGNSSTARSAPGLPLEWDRSSADPLDWTARLARTGPCGRRRSAFIRRADPRHRNGSVPGASTNSDGVPSRT